MKRILIIAILVFELAGCCSYIDTLGHWHSKRESLDFTNNYCIYNYESNIFGVCDNEEHIPAHYQIYIPNKLKNMGGVGDDRFFYIQEPEVLQSFRIYLPGKENMQKD